MTFKKEDIINALMVLEKSDGWKIICKAIDENIKQTQSKLNGELGEITGLEELHNLQNMLIDRKGLKNLPTTIIESLKDADSVPVELDPYE